MTFENMNTPVTEAPKLTDEQLAELLAKPAVAFISTDDSDDEGTAEAPALN